MAEFLHAITNQTSRVSNIKLWRAQLKNVTWQIWRFWPLFHLSFLFFADQIFIEQVSKDRSMALYGLHFFVKSLCVIYSFAKRERESFEFFLLLFCLLGNEKGGTNFYELEHWNWTFFKWWSQKLRAQRSHKSALESRLKRSVRSVKKNKKKKKRRRREKRSNRLIC